MEDLIEQGFWSFVSVDMKSLQKPHYSLTHSPVTTEYSTPFQIYGNTNIPIL